MNSRLVLFLGLALAVVVSQVSASSHGKRTCNCGMSGGGINACSCQQVVVRPPKPQKLHITGGPKVVCTKVHGPARLNPIGDLCTCGHSYVQPAHVPKQHCPVCHNRGESSYYKEESDSVHALPLPYHSYHGAKSYAYQESESEHHLADQYEEQETHDYFDNHIPHHPADAVSLTLAYEQAKRHGKAVREEGLNFGPRTIPKDGYVSKQHNDIPEDRLYSFDKQVVELRYPKGPHGCSRAALEEEAEDALLAAQEEELVEEEAHMGKHGAYLSYADLGYAPETHKQHEFVPGHSGFPHEEGFPYGGEVFTMPLKKPCALKHGSMIVHDEEEYHEEQESSEYGSSEEEEGVDGYQIISSGGGPSYEEESAHQQHHPAFFGKLIHAATGHRGY